MANTRTVIAGGGGDHTTIGSAITWVQSNHDFGTDGIATISIQDTSEYNENISLSGFTGTTTASAYLLITVSAGNRHSGVAGTGHARIRGSTSGTHVITQSTDFSQVEYLEIQQDSNGSSDEAFRLTSGVSDLVISRCIVWNDQTAADSDGFYAGDYSAERIRIDNCVIYGFQRAGVNSQMFSGAHTHSWDIDHCTMVKNGASGEGETGIHSRTADAGATVTINVYNTFSDDAGHSECFDETNGGGTHTWTGTHNACTDTSLTSRSLTTGANESLTVNTTNFTNVTAGTEDYSLPGSGSALYDAGTDRQGSEPDSRQDFSTDIAGNARGTTNVDQGAFEFQAAAGATGKSNPIDGPLGGSLSGMVGL